MRLLPRFFSSLFVGDLNTCLYLEINSCSRNLWAKAITCVMSTPMQMTPHVTSAIDNLAKLVSFDTTSRNSNLDLIDWVESYLQPLGAILTRVPNEDGTKTNLIATFGPQDVSGGVILSGHTDVVPVDGQDWHTDPWVLTQKDGKLYGRGTCDMKGFSACVLALAPAMAAAKLTAPIHIALSYDEEIGCLGAHSLVSKLNEKFPGAAAVIIGEPSDMKVVSGQKGLASSTVEITGREAHSSQIQQGVSAIMEAIPLMAALHEMAADARLIAPTDSPFEPPGTSITIGLVDGGTAVNILARQCSFTFDIRYEAGDDPRRYEDELRVLAEAADARIKARAPEGGAVLIRRSLSPAMTPEVNGAAEALARALTGDNTLRAVAYATEGGIFQNGGLSTVICGPGSIAQAHQPDEFVAVEQMVACVTFLEKLVARMSA
jgi:acetylornithine deacetylase